MLIQREGHVVYNLLNTSTNNDGSMDALGDALSEKIQNLHEDGLDEQYLVEVKKGILALGDFIQILDQDEIEALIHEIDFASYLSDNVKAGALEEMSLAEKAKLALMFKNVSNDNAKPAFVKHEFNSEPVNVVSYDVSANTENKSEWFDHAFQTDENQETPQKQISCE